MEESRIEKGKSLNTVAEDQIITVMENLAVGVDAVNIKKTYTKDRRVSVWEIKVPVTKGGTKIYTYQRKANNGKGIVMAYFSNNNKKRNITRTEIIAEEVKGNIWVVYSDGESIERK